MGFGSDFAGVEDIDPNWTFLEGDENEKIALAQCIARRFILPRGGNPWAQQDGFDLRQLLSDTANVSTVEGMIEAEARKDERIEDCEASITSTGQAASTRWEVSINCKTTDGDLSFTIGVSSVTVDLLKVG